MNVIFVSESSGSAEKRVRAVLDRYATRIGSATWVAAFTEEGLDDVRRELRAVASKSTSVACHRVVSRREIRLAWIVGSRKLFNRNGEIRVHETRTGILYEDQEPTAPQRILSFLVMLAGLFHDLGKSNAGFQLKLRNPKPEADDIRHELVSVLMLNQVLDFEHLSDDGQWLEALVKGERWAKLKDAELFDLSKVSSNRNDALIFFPKVEKTPLLYALCWLVVSHHRLPSYDAGFDFTGKNHLRELEGNKKLPGKYAKLGRLEKNPTNSTVLPQTGASPTLTPNTVDTAVIPADGSPESRLQGCPQPRRPWSLGSGDPPIDGHNLNLTVLSLKSEQQGSDQNSPPWKQQAFKERAAKLAKRLQTLLAEETALPSLDAVMLFGRLGFQMADHKISSADECVKDVTVDKETPGLFANTIKKSNCPPLFRQGLGVHLTKVSEEAGQTLQLLFGLEKRLPHIAYEDLPEPLLGTGTDPRFRWQDDAARRVRQIEGIAEAGFFGVVMAGTGSGKTIGCPKIMAAASDGLRLVYASALRSLTLQTGSALRDDLGFGKDAMAVVVGSELVKKLYDLQQHDKKSFDYEEEGMESAGFDQEFELDGGGDFDFDPKLEALLKQLFKEQKVRDFLTVPVLSATLDSIMKSADARRGSHLAHALRVLSSDLILDEIDLYSPEDLAAVGRLVFQTGLAGRKLAIASATIPPPVAKHLFAAYWQGCQQHAGLFGKPFPVHAGWFAEDCADNKVLPCGSTDIFDAAHAGFVQTRLDRLQTLEPRRRVRRFAQPDTLIKDALFGAVFEACLELHSAHFIMDEKTGKRVSIGAVQWGRVSTCMDFSLYAARREAGEVAHFLVCHHARFFLAVRNEVEWHLDDMLRRKIDPNRPLQNKFIRDALEKTQCQDVMVIVSTTLESTGRDHDFDWGVVEPVSARTVVQFAGRIHRHRTGLDADNLIVMGYPMRRIEKPSADACYCKPGPEETLDEGARKYRLVSHEAAEVLPVTVIDAGLSIRDYGPFEKTIFRAGQLAELEQLVMDNWLADGLARDYLGQPRKRLGSYPAETYKFRRTQQQLLYWMDENDEWQVCQDGEFERSESVWDRVELIKEVPEERFLLRHGVRLATLYDGIIEKLHESDRPAMRCLLSGINLPCYERGNEIPEIRFHGLLGLDKE